MTLSQSGTAAMENFIVGLRNAHAVENQALAIMKPQIARLENYPDIAERLRLHQDETEAQIGRLEEVLESLGETHSTLKDAGGSLMGALASLGHSFTGDEILKNSFANFAFENYEIAAYRSLLTMADMAGVGSAAAVLRQSLQEEEDMAGWIEDHLEETTRRYLTLHDGGQTAKR